MDPPAVAKTKGYIIHLGSARERDPYVRGLQETFFIPLEVVAASTGESWLTHPAISKQHVRTGEQVTQGMLGCAHSHIDLLYASVKGGVGELYVFEDDCALIAPPSAIAHWVDLMKQSTVPWDILLLGANEYVESKAGWIHSDEHTAEFPVMHVTRFWGTHAMIIRPAAMRAALKTFAEAQREGRFLPADWMWNEAIRREGLLVFGPLQPKSFCQQIPGLVSAITGTVRIGQI
jgi:GR25 family glycosyltransferase involved in LPS biosynthesis